jgi:hypothetical protein
MLVIPAKAGIQFSSQINEELDSSFRWNDEQGQRRWIPAFAGMTSEIKMDSRLRGNDGNGKGCRTP